MDILTCCDMNAQSDNLLNYHEDEDKCIQIDNMSLNETDNFHLELRSIVMVNN